MNLEDLANLGQMIGAIGVMNQNEDK